MGHPVEGLQIVPPFMTRTLFTLGYQKRDLEEFIDLLRAASINVLVDRSILADSWRQRGRRKVEHLATDGAPRLLAK